MRLRAEDSDLIARSDEVVEQGIVHRLQAVIDGDADERVELSQVLLLWMLTDMIRAGRRNRPSYRAGRLDIFVRSAGHALILRDSERPYHLHVIMPIIRGRSLEATTVPVKPFIFLEERDLPEWDNYESEKEGSE